VFTACPAGKFCIKGLAYNCFAGYLCLAGADTPTPTDGTKGQLCSLGHYCAAGTTTETACQGTNTNAAQGTYNPYQGAEDVSFCLPCPDGAKCETDGLSVPLYNSCPAGYYCDDGVQTPCEAGFRCPAGYDYKERCPLGWYQD